MKTTHYRHPQKKLSLLMLLGSFGLFALISLVLTPLYSLSNSDILFSTTVIPELLRTTIDLLEVCVFAVSFSILLFSVFLQYRTTRLTVLYLGAILFRRIAVLAVTLVFNGAIGAEDLFSSITNLLLESLLVLFVLWIARARKNRLNQQLAEFSKASALFSSDAPEKPDPLRLFPFKKLYSKENPIQSCVLWIGVLLSALKVLSRLIFDIGYGAPTDIWEVLLMLVYYLSDLLIGVIFYVLSVLFLTRLFRRYGESDTLSD